MLEEIKPCKVMKYFEEISKIPRKSGEEDKIVEYLKNFAIERNLEYYTDNYRNIIIKKNATPGKENNKPIALQAHTDMICEKTPESKHDFSKDGLDLYVEDDFIKAKGTTLGADNGIGVAIILAVLDCEKIKAPKLECIFTSEEETTMLGAINLDLDNIESNRIISLDNGKEGKILVSSAECNEWKGIINFRKDKLTKKGFELVYDNFKGGHSGGNIGDETRGNPIKLAIEILKQLEEVQLADIRGGSRVNVIPREVSVKFVTENKNAEEIIIKEINKQKEYYGKDVKIELNEIEEISEVIDKENTKKIIEFITEFQNGAIKRDEQGNVLQSGNMAKVKTNETNIEIEFSERSNMKDYEKEYLANLNNLIKKYDVEILWSQNLKGVPKRETNTLTGECEKLYKELYNEEMEEIVSQGVVEGGFFVSKKPSCEYVCIGPNTFDVHSPSERLSITSTKKIWKFIKELLNKM